jgi:aspartate-semialdehyde dehydrogenase
MLEILESRDFPVDTLYPLASARSAGKSVQFRGKRHVVQDLSEFDFSQTPIALFSAGGDISAEYAPIAAAAGCVVIDNTSHFRRDDDIPLVIPEVNPQGDQPLRQSRDHRQPQLLHHRHVGGAQANLRRCWHRAN